MTTPDVNPSDRVELCEPCANTQSCPLGSACATLSGNNEFCATLCPRGTECDSDDTCTLVPSAQDGEILSACVPNSGTCAPAKMPEVDGAPIEHCGPLEGPTVLADCRSCNRNDSDCQANGCYAGWWCDMSRKPVGRCRKPPTNCP